MQHNNRKNQKGFTLFEILLVVVVGIVLVAGAIIYFGQASGTQKAQALQSQTMAVVSGVRKVYPGPTYTGLSASGLVTAGAVPTDMISGTSLVNVFTGAVTVAPATNPTGAPSDNTFAITHTQVPKDACNVIGANMQASFSKLVVGTTTIKDSKATTPVVYSASALATACDNESNSLTFTN